MEDRRVEIETALLFDYLKDKQVPSNYIEKYNIVKTILTLRKCSDALNELVVEKKKIEEEYGYELYILQDILYIAYTRGDLASYYPLPDKIEKKVFELKNGLECFKVKMTDILIRECGKGGVIFGQ